MSPVVVTRYHRLMNSQNPRHGHGHGGHGITGANANNKFATLRDSVTPSRNDSLCVISQRVNMSLLMDKCIYTASTNN